jgi:hypothetical protein
LRWCILELVLLRTLVEGDAEHGALVEEVLELADAPVDVDIVVYPGDGDRGSARGDGKAGGGKVERGGVFVDDDRGGPQVAAEVVLRGRSDIDVTTLVLHPSAIRATGGSTPAPIL